MLPKVVDGPLLIGIAAPRRRRGQVPLPLGQQLGGCRGRRDSRRHPRDDRRRQVLLERLERLEGRRHRHRDPEIALLRKREAARHDADHQIRLVVEADGVVDHVAPTELALPESVRQHRHVGGAGVPLVRGEGPTDGAADAEGGEEVRRDDAHRETGRPLRIGEIESADRPAGRTREPVRHRVDILDVDETGVGLRKLLSRAGIERDVDIGQRHQLLRMRKRQRAEQRRVDRAEHRRRRPDAQRQHDDHRRREPPPLREPPGGVADVLAKRFQPPEAPLIAGLFFDPRGVAEHAPSLRIGFGVANASIAQLRGPQLAVQPHLFFQLAGGAVAR